MLGIGRRANPSLANDRIDANRMRRDMMVMLQFEVGEKLSESKENAMATLYIYLEELHTIAAHPSRAQAPSSKHQPCSFL
jgi:hypothetical protein